MTLGKRTRILVADDHFIARRGLIGSLSSEEDLEIIAEACNGPQAVELSALHRPQLILMDVRLPIKDGIAAAREIIAVQPEVKILILTVSEAEEDILGALDAGVMGYLYKSVERAELLLAIRSVAEGQAYFQAEIQVRMKTISRVTLTAREEEVLRAIVRGFSNKEIADLIGIAEPTVRLHVTHILRKLAVMDRTQAAIMAVRRGLVRID